MAGSKAVLRTHHSTSSHWVGDGFPVRTIFSYTKWTHELTPFLLLDHAGPADFEPAARPRGVDWHPHRGFETVTLVLEGAVDHEDSAGHRGSIAAGDVQWMTAGAGVLHKEMHSEAFTRQGGRLEVLQLWVNLPAALKMTAPAYQALLAEHIPVVALPGGGRVRVVAGEHAGQRGPARTHTRVLLLDARLQGNEPFALSVPEGDTVALYVLDGELVLEDGQRVGGGDLALYGRAGTVVTMTAAADSTLLVMSGEPIDEPVAGYGPFVMNTREQIEQALADARSGTLGSAAGRRS